MSRLTDFANHLYRGDVSYDFVGKAKRWYVISAVILLVSVASLIIKGLTFGIEFEGGATFTLPSQTLSVEDARSVTVEIVSAETRVTELTSPSGDRQLRVETPPISPDDSGTIRDALAEAAGIEVTEVSVQQIGPSWGEQITEKALVALAVFIAIVVIFLSLMFEWRMALAAIVALVHDVLITAGIYSLVGFLVTPATVIGFLTILGYSLYDTVVVFDKVRENTRGLLGAARITYSQAANLAVNQTLVRSINTSIVALLPVAAILYGGVVLLGAGVLQDLALALFVGMLAGTYSSIFIATPLLAQLKEQEPQYRQLAKRVAARQSAGRLPAAAKKAPAPAAGPAGSAAEPAASEEEAPVGAGVRPATSQARVPQPKRGGSRPSGRSKRRPSGKKRR